MQKEKYGLALTKNSKTGWAFSIPRKYTCIGKTNVCYKLCYGNGIRYQSPGAKRKRERNYRTIKFLLSKGGPELLAENLVYLIDQARPVDWIAAQISETATEVPWTLRIHDIGDFPAIPEYIDAWKIACKQRSDCSFWFYTRSLQMLEHLTELASLPNCQGWLSADSENYSEVILAYATAPQVWKLSILQQATDRIPNDFYPDILRAVSSNRLVNFPYHISGRHVVPAQEKELVHCPQVLGQYTLNAGSGEKPCQTCSYCLP